MVELAITQLREAATKARAWARKNPWPVFLLAVGLGAFLWVLVETIRLDNMGFQEKTFWNWMELLLVPVVLALAGLWFSRVQKQIEQEIARQEREVDREVARDRRHQGTLEAYFDRMTELLLEKDLGRIELDEEGEDPEGGRGDLAASIARARTLTVLRALDPARVGAVLRFLLETKVGEKSVAEIVPLADGNLKGVKWTGQEANLISANLSGADLSKSDLSGASLLGADLSEVYLREADLSGAELFGANLSGAELIGADLFGANLGGANLSGASLSGAKLSGADLGGAVLSGAALSGAELIGANLDNAHVTTEQLLEAKTLEGATMPDGTKYEEWIKGQHAEQVEGHEQDD